MADVAHDASGPASPKPGDIAPQQASRPDSPDRGKLRVFISYSREDLPFPDQLDAVLNACGFDCVIDRHGISGGEDWKRRLGNERLPKRWCWRAQLVTGCVTACVPASHCCSGVNVGWRESRRPSAATFCL